SRCKRGYWDCTTPSEGSKRRKADDQGRKDNCSGAITLNSVRGKEDNASNKFPDIAELKNNAINANHSDDNISGNNEFIENAIVHVDKPGRCDGIITGYDAANADK